MRSVGLLGGTFNPPHAGHLHAARTALEALRLDELWFVPDAEPPHKALPPGTPTAADRVAMTGALASMLPGTSVCTIEQTLPAPSYTARTLTALAELYPDTAFTFIVGSDMFFTLERWYQPTVIFSHAAIAALAREDEDAKKLDAYAAQLRERFSARVTILYTRALPVSSTELRKCLLRGTVPELLPAPVLDIIRERGLYR
ncbi:MAG: nicotinate (nicotinamide) nucleotide adenylyltransferase [Clostridiaceae bacterium]|nr:nicotinate (nicotinamide) nucleotide adenylyltransferase [Clostridiaceae bacterium]